MRRIRWVVLLCSLCLGGAVALAAPPGFPAFLRQWGSGGAAPGAFHSLDQVVIDARGQVYVADRQNNRIEKFDHLGHLITIIGTQGSAPGQFQGPRGVAVDGLGDLYVADSGNNRIQKFDPRGHLLAVWGRNGGDGSAGIAPAQFNDPRGIATDAAGELYVADHGNNRIQKLSTRGRSLAVWGRDGGNGSPGSGNGEFHLPRGVTVDRFGDVYVADKDNNRIQEFDSRGRFLRRWGRNGGDGTAGTGDGEFHTPYSVAAGPAELYVADTDNNRLQEFTFDGRFIARLGHNGGDGSAGSAPGEFSTPYSVGVDCRGNLYVSDEGNERVQVFGVPSGPLPACPPAVRLGRLPARPRQGALRLTASCDRPCSLSVHAVLTVNGQVARRASRATLGLGVERRSLRVALPQAVLGALRQHRRVRVSVSVAPTGFGGAGRTVIRRSLVLSI
jgi:DNA-binding beta-propeller fold protein YncE